MATRLRLATFNLENLFTRHDFRGFTDSRSARYLDPIVQFLGNYGDGDLSQFGEFKRLVQAAAIAQEDDKRQHTALAIAEADADIYGLQEVDNVDALQRFFDAYVKKIGVDSYPQFVLHEGNDPRGIDVAAIARDIRPIVTRSHAHLSGAWVDDTQTGMDLLAKYPRAEAARDKLRGRIFRRDCLEIEVRSEKEPQKTLATVFVCHFKSMSGGRSESMGMRQLEAITVRELITRKFGDPATANWVVMGDLNDYTMKIAIMKSTDSSGDRVEKITKEANSGVAPLLDDDFGFNTLEALPEPERWTHYYPAQAHKTQLDYIIASPAMKSMINGDPKVIRSGMPYRVPNTDSSRRYPRIGWDRPKASDHCPIVVEFQIP